MVAKRSSGTSEKGWREWLGRAPPCGPRQAQENVCMWPKSCEQNALNASIGDSDHASEVMGEAQDGGGGGGGAEHFYVHSTSEKHGVPSAPGTTVLTSSALCCLRSCTSQSGSRSLSPWRLSKTRGSDSFSFSAS